MDFYLQYSFLWKICACPRPALNNWTMVGEVLVPGVLKPGDIDRTDGCRQAAALADQI